MAISNINTDALLTALEKKCYKSKDTVISEAEYKEKSFSIDKLRYSKIKQIKIIEELEKRVLNESQAIRLKELKLYKDTSCFSRFFDAKSVARFQLFQKRISLGVINDNFDPLIVADHFKDLAKQDHAKAEAYLSYAMEYSSVILAAKDINKLTKAISILKSLVVEFSNIGKSEKIVVCAKLIFRLQLKILKPDAPIVKTIKKLLMIQWDRFNIMALKTSLEKNDQLFTFDQIITPKPQYNFQAAVPKFQNLYSKRASVKDVEFVHKIAEDLFLQGKEIEAAECFYYLNIYWGKKQNPIKEREALHLIAECFIHAGIERVYGVLIENIEFSNLNIEKLGTWYQLEFLKQLCEGNDDVLRRRIQIALKEDTKIKIDQFIELFTKPKNLSLIWLQIGFHLLQKNHLGKAMAALWNSITVSLNDKSIRQLLDLECLPSKNLHASLSLSELKNVAVKLYQTDKVEAEELQKMLPHHKKQTANIVLTVISYIEKINKGKLTKKEAKLGFNLALELLIDGDHFNAAELLFYLGKFWEGKKKHKLAQECKRTFLKCMGRKKLGLINQPFSSHSIKGFDDKAIKYYTQIGIYSMRKTLLVENKEQFLNLLDQHMKGRNTRIIFSYLDILIFNGFPAEALTYLQKLRALESTSLNFQLDLMVLTCFIELKKINLTLAAKPITSRGLNRISFNRFNRPMLQQLVADLLQEKPGTLNIDLNEKVLYRKELKDHIWYPDEMVALDSDQEAANEYMRQAKLIRKRFSINPFKWCKKRAAEKHILIKIIQIGLKKKVLTGNSNLAEIKFADLFKTKLKKLRSYADLVIINFNNEKKEVVDTQKAEVTSDKFIPVRKPGEFLLDLFQHHSVRTDPKIPPIPPNTTHLRISNAVYRINNVELSPLLQNETIEVTLTYSPLFSWIKENKSVKTLDLEDFGGESLVVYKHAKAMSKNNFQELLDGLKVNNTIKTLRLDNLDTIWTQEAFLDPAIKLPEGLKLLFQALKENRGVEHLVLSNLNKWDNDTLLAFSDYIKDHHTALKQLTIGPVKSVKLRELIEAATKDRGAPLAVVYS